jgi:hypothetical protein
MRPRPADRVQSDDDYPCQDEDQRSDRDGTTRGDRLVTLTCLLGRTGPRVAEAHPARRYTGRHDRPQLRLAGDLSCARFPSVSTEAAHYESFYLKVADPRTPRGAWIRYTVFKRAGELPCGSLWCTLWTGDEGALARKATLQPHELSAAPGELIKIGASRLTLMRAVGSVDEASWELEFAGAGMMFPYLPREWMYRARVPRTKAVSLEPHATFHGRVTVGGQTLQIDGWPGMVGHNWGSEHAEGWVWLHGADFVEAPESWFDATIGRIKLGAVTVPWIANGGLWLDGRMYRVGGPIAVRSTSVNAQPTHCRFTLPGRGIAIDGQVAAPDDSTVAWRYSDPAGGEHYVSNCSVASLALTVRGHDREARRLHLRAGAAYEHGAREPPPAVPIQPFPDP